MKTLNWPRILSLYDSGLTANKISILLGCDRRTIDRKILSLGIKRPHRINNKCFELNEEYFKIINTGESAYWFGFLLADASIPRRPGGKSMQVLLGIKDKPHLESLLVAISANNPIKIGFRNNKQNAALNIHSTRFCDFMLAMGWREFKERGIWPSIRPDLERHFVRGLIDGDGWVSIVKKKYPEIGLCSDHKTVLLESQRVLGIHANILLSRSKKSKKNIYKWRKVGRDCVRMHSVLYNNATCFLPRKKEYLESIIASWPTAQHGLLEENTKNVAYNNGKN